MGVGVIQVVEACLEVLEALVDQEGLVVQQLIKVEELEAPFWLWDQF